MCHPSLHPASLSGVLAGWLTVLPCLSGQVAGHFPLRSGGEHGDTPELLADVLPLLQRYQVDAYLSGGWAS